MMSLYIFPKCAFGGAKLKMTNKFAVEDWMITPRVNDDASVKKIKE
jgi:hypothetical protein